MTTEVLRNMLYAGSQSLAGLGYVVMDEVHYLSDRFRGAVWEEVIIHLPESVTLVSLSATVSNAEEFGDWLDTVRGDTQVIVSEHRPVPLWQHVLAGRRMYDLFEEGDRAEARPARGQPRPGAAGPDGEPAARTTRATAARGKMVREADRERERRQRSRIWTPGRPEVIDRLDAEGLLPAITFIFSRAGCEAAVQQCLYAGLRLNDEDGARHRCARSSRSARPPSRTRTCTSSGYFEWLEGLERGHRRAPRRACCRPSRRSSRSCSSAAWSRPSSPPRPWPSASTCPRARWCWRSSSSGTASSTPTSPPASTPSSPAVPGGAASTSRATRWCCGSAAWTRARSPDSPARARIRCAPASSRRTTWRSTWSRSSGGTARASCWRPPSRSSRPTSRSSGSPGRCSERGGPGGLPGGR